MEPDTTCSLDDTRDVVSSACFGCKNCADRNEYKCKVYGECPETYWNDEKPCPERIPLEEKKPS